jgi:predicted Zn-dependent peptidase
VLFTSFANAHNGYGDFVDLNAATVADCAEFFDTFYAPGNAVLTVCGDFDPAQAGEWVERHFHDIAFRPAPVRPSFAEPAPTSVLRADHLDPHAPAPALAVGWRLPDPVADLSGYLAFIALAGILSDGESSRLQSTVVAQQNLATDLWATPGLLGGPLDSRDPDVFVLGAIHPVEVPAEAVIDASAEQIGRVAADGPEPDELQRALARFAASLYRDNDAIASRTRSLGSLELLHGRAELLGELPGLLSALTADDIAAAAAALDPDRCAVLRILPDPSGRGAVA